MFGSRRSKETNPIYMLVRQGWAKQAPINFGEIWPRESKPRSKYVWVQKVKGNESYIYVCWCREAEWNKPQYFLEKLGQGKVNPGQSLSWWKWNPYICDCETKPYFGGHGAEGNVSQISPASQYLSNGTIQGRGKRHAYLVGKTGETNPIQMLVPWSWEKRTPTSFLRKPGPRKLTPKLVLSARRKVTLYICV